MTGKMFSVNNRILAGCNQQLDSNGFRGNIECKWNANAFDGKGAPVFTNKDGNTIESYSYWYALRKNALETMWTCANCGVMSKVCIKNANLEFEGVVNRRYEGVIGKEINIRVIVPEDLAGAALSIDPVTPLPQGLSFEDNAIKGKLNGAYNGFIHIIAEKDGVKRGSSIEIFVPASATKVPGKAGCFGGLETTLSIVGLFAVAAIGLFFVLKKKRVNA